MSDYPADGTIDDAKAWVADGGSATVALEQEIAGKGRSTLISWLEEQTAPEAEDSPEAEEKEPEEPAAPARLAGKTFVAKRRLRYQSQWYEVGAVIPGADQWPRTESWIRQGWIKEAPVGGGTTFAASSTHDYNPCGCG